MESFKKIPTDLRSKLRRHLLKRGVYVGKYSKRVTISERLFKVTQQEELHQWTDEEIVVTIKELAEPLATRALRNRLNHTCDGLLGQPTAIVAIPPRSSTQTPTQNQQSTPATMTQVDISGS